MQNKIIERLEPQDNYNPEANDTIVSWQWKVLKTGMRELKPGDAFRTRNPGTHELKTTTEWDDISPNETVLICVEEPFDELGTGVYSVYATPKLKDLSPAETYAKYLEEKAHDTTEAEL